MQKRAFWRESETMRDIEAVLFDLDGTLVDTSEFVYQAYEYTFRVHGLPVIQREKMASVMGLTLEECYRSFYPLEDINRLCQTHFAFQEDHLELSVPFPHTVQTLKMLKAADLKIAIVTTRSKRTSIQSLKLGGMVEYCDMVISVEDVAYAKPHPEALLRALYAFRVEAERAVMVGDTNVDILAGKNAGTLTVGVTYGFQGAYIVDSQPHIVIHDIGCLPAIVIDSMLDEIKVGN